ncbi:MAG: hypothetical protein ACOC6C_01270 [Verrucomicrobiota bacterium]
MQTDQGAPRALVVIEAAQWLPVQLVPGSIEIVNADRRILKPGERSWRDTGACWGDAVRYRFRYNVVSWLDREVGVECDLPLNERRELNTVKSKWDMIPWPERLDLRDKWRGVACSEWMKEEFGDLLLESAERDLAGRVRLLADVSSSVLQFVENEYPGSQGLGTAYRSFCISPEDEWAVRLAALNALAPDFLKDAVGKAGLRRLNSYDLPAAESVGKSMEGFARCSTILRGAVKKDLPRTCMEKITRQRVVYYENVLDFMNGHAYATLPEMAEALMVRQEFEEHFGDKATGLGMLIRTRIAEAITESISNIHSDQHINHCCAFVRKVPDCFKWREPVITIAKKQALKRLEDILAENRDLSRCRELADNWAIILPDSIEQDLAEVEKILRNANKQGSESRDWHKILDVRQDEVSAKVPDPVPEPSVNWVAPSVWESLIGALKHLEVMREGRRNVSFFLPESSDLLRGLVWRQNRDFVA